MMEGLCNFNDFSEVGTGVLSCTDGLVRRGEGRGKGGGWVLREVGEAEQRSQRPLRGELWFVTGPVGVVPDGDFQLESPQTWRDTLLKTKSRQREGGEDEQLGEFQATQASGKIGLYKRSDQASPPFISISEGKVPRREHSVQEFPFGRGRGGGRRGPEA